MESVQFSPGLDLDLDLESTTHTDRTTHHAPGRSPWTSPCSRILLLDLRLRSNPSTSSSRRRDASSAFIPHRSATAFHGPNSHPFLHINYSRIIPIVHPENVSCPTSCPVDLASNPVLWYFGRFHTESDSYRELDDGSHSSIEPEIGGQYFLTKGRPRMVEFNSFPIALDDNLDLTRANQSFRTTSKFLNLYHKHHPNLDITSINRQGSPTPTMSSLPIILQPTLRHLGQPGLDFLLASWAILVSRIVSKTLETGSFRDEELPDSSRGKSSDLIVFESEDRTGGDTPSGLSRGVREDGPFPPDPEEIQVITGQREYGTLPPIPLEEPNEKPVQSFSRSFWWFLGFVISLTFLPGLILPLEYPSSFSAPLASSTPLSIGCVLSATPHHLDSLIKETDRLASTAKILLWPEQALQLYSLEDREIVIRKVTDVAQRHGVWIGLGLGSPRSPDEEGEGEEDEPDSSKRRNEIVFVGPEGLVGVYTKRKLVPIVESYGLLPGTETPPLWEIGLTTPRGIRKPEWSKNAPFVRTLGVTPLICLDSLHPGTLTVPSTGPRHKGPRVPELILLATSPPSHSSAIASMILDHAKDLAV
jgi:hypothetical protein